MEAQSDIVVAPDLMEAFEQGWRSSRVLLFSAPFGFGKAETVKVLLAKEKTAFFNAAEPETLNGSVPRHCKCVVVDDLQMLKDPERQQTLCGWIREPQPLDAAAEILRVQGGPLPELPKQINVELEKETK